MRGKERDRKRREREKDRRKEGGIIKDRKDEIQGEIETNFRNVRQISRQDKMSQNEIKNKNEVRKKAFNSNTCGFRDN